MNTTLVNGQSVSVIPVSDRGLLYGDGVFETLAVRNGYPLFWEDHLARLKRGCKVLGLPDPDAMLLRQEADALTGGVHRSVLKLIVTRGSGGRGYRMPEKIRPTRIVALHPWPDYPDTFANTGVRVRLCAMRLGHNPVLAGIKHLNRIEQVLARAEWEDENILEGLMLDQAGHLIEGTMSNVFLVRRNRLVTPDLVHCGVQGIVRSRVLALAATDGIEVEVREVRPHELYEADEVFICNSVIGILPVTGIEDQRLAAGVLTANLQQQLEHLVAGEAGNV